MDKTATIFDIGRFRNEDGPGIRTIIFFKGCPLRCAWCSNPFGLTKFPQLAVNKERCTGCRQCMDVCPNGVNQIMKDGKVGVDFSKCTLCSSCVLKCPVSTRMISGKEYTARELFTEAYKDYAFYRKNDGGVTLSGGEVLMQYEVAAEVLRLCRKNYISTCIETSGFAPWEHLEQVAQYCSIIFIDLKHMDSKKHQEYTGVPNELILSNIIKLCDYADNRGIKVVIRRPVIPGFSDGVEEMIQAAQFVAGLSGNPELNLLPYHNMGEAKYDMIGAQNTNLEMNRIPHTSPLMLLLQETCMKYAVNNRISIGGDAIDLSV